MNEVALNICIILHTIHPIVTRKLTQSFVILLIINWINLASNVQIVEMYNLNLKMEKC